MSFLFRAARLAAIFMVAGLLGLGGYGGSHAMAQSAADAAKVTTAAEAMDLYLTLMDRIAGALESVKDDASADAAAQTISETSQVMNVLGDKAKNQITPQDWVAATTPRQQEFAQVQTRMSMALMQLAQTNPALMQRLGNTMQDLPTVGR
tara:strand:+ start:216 stop:665 length:450 start_codon:yes stop_codon:yes gene_type:complete